jgi:DNA-binding transcriptional LysR family regulator
LNSRSTLKDSGLIARKLASDTRILCASPSYIAQYGEPESPEMLKKHNCIQLFGLEDWIFQTAQSTLSIKVSGNLKTDNGEAMRDACVNGLGIAMNSTWSVYQHLATGKLKVLLSDYPLISEAAIWCVYPSSRQLATKVRAFIDFFCTRFAEPVYWNDGLPYSP